MTLLLSTAALFFFSLVRANPVDFKQRALDFDLRQALTNDFADPSIIQDGNTFYAFATTKDGINVQVAKSQAMSSGWTFLTGVDALPSSKLGSWVNEKDPQVWAPHVIKNDDGKYVLYYSALKDGSKHCVGAAVADKIQGPYEGQKDPLFCDMEKGGAIDPSGFQDADGSRYVVYKVDGNSIGHGGTCNNMNKPIVPTPIMIQRVKGDGYSPIGKPTQILDRGERDGPLIEAPAMVQVNGTYVLFFSSNCYATSWYDISYAMSTNILGPYTKYGPFALTGWAGTYAPGGATPTQDGKYLVFHSGDVTVAPHSRTMYVAAIEIDPENHQVRCAV